jgi:hypothetical protein
LVPWCSGLTCGPVKAEIAGSNPVGTASIDNLMTSHQVVFVLVSNQTVASVDQLLPVVQPFFLIVK